MTATPHTGLKERAVERFAEKGEREKFYSFFHQVEGLYDVLSPDAFLRDYIDDYRALSELYATVQLAYSQRIYTDLDLTEQTRRLLREHTSLYRLRATKGATRPWRPCRQLDFAATVHPTYWSSSTSRCPHLSRILCAFASRRPA